MKKQQSPLDNISFDKVSINSKGNGLLILHKKDGDKYKLLIKKIINYNINNWTKTLQIKFLQWVA